MRILFLLYIFFAACLNQVWAQEVYQAHTHVQLVSEQEAVLAGQTFWAGVDVHLDQGWHVYWKNPGDAGMSPKIKWVLPDGFKAGDIHWPYPVRLDSGPLTNFGYDDHVLLLVPVIVSDDQPSAAVNLRATVSWLTCREICIPGKAELNLPVSLIKGLSPIAFNQFKSSFDQARQDLPQELTAITSNAFLEDNLWHLNIDTALKTGGSVTFYPFRNDVIEHAQAQQTQINGKGYGMLLTKSHLFQGPLQVLEGIAVNPEGWNGDKK